MNTQNDEFMLVLKMRISLNDLEFTQDNRIGAKLLHLALLSGLKANGIQLTTPTEQPSGTLNRLTLLVFVREGDVRHALASISDTLKAVGLYHRATIWFQTAEAYWRVASVAQGYEDKDKDLISLEPLRREIDDGGKEDCIEANLCNGVRHLAIATQMTLERRAAA
jgi:hypothetical protein